MRPTNTLTTQPPLPRTFQLIKMVLNEINILGAFPKASTRIGWESPLSAKSRRSSSVFPRIRTKEAVGEVGSLVWPGATGLRHPGFSPLFVAGRIVVKEQRWKIDSSVKHRVVSQKVKEYLKMTATPNWPSFYGVFSDYTLRNWARHGSFSIVFFCRTFTEVLKLFIWIFDLKKQSWPLPNS